LNCLLMSSVIIPTVRNWEGVVNTSTLE
jgi:hypothetical protein